jgi:DNA-binding transcriptional ArsR family regulator
VRQGSGGCEGRLQQAENILRALAEPRRLAILRLIRARELRAGEISRHFRTTRPAISQHLRVLVRAGLVTERREGTRRLYRVRPQGFAQLKQYLESFWDERLARLKSAAEREMRNKGVV